MSTLLDNESAIIIKKAIGSYPSESKGNYVEGAINYIDIVANIQPLNGDELQLLKEGDRTKSSLKIYSSSELADDYFIRRSNENVSQVITCTIDNIVDDTDYICTINGTEFLYNSGIGATAESIVVGIVAEITGTILIEITDNLDGTYTIISTVKGTSFTIEVDENQSYVVNVENVQKQYKLMKTKDYTSHNIKYYKSIGILMERENGL